MAPPVASLPIHEEVSVTRAPRARDTSLWSALFIYAVFSAILGLIIVGSLAPSENLEWSIPSEAWTSSVDAPAPRLPLDQRSCHGHHCGGQHDEHRCAPWRHRRLSRVFRCVRKLGPTFPSRISQPPPPPSPTPTPRPPPPFLRCLGRRAASSSPANWQTPSATTRRTRASSSTITARSCCST